MNRVHTDRQYENELTSLREQVLYMGASVEELLTGAVRAYSDRDPALAKRIAGLDAAVDQLELDIDDACLHVLARRQPVAGDLRFLTTALKVVTDLERIGDLASNICERVQELGPVGRPVDSVSITKMADIAREMLRDALDAFVAGDVPRAQAVIQRDEEVDDLYADLFPTLVQQMMARPELVDAGMRVLSIAKYLERIADHTTNLAEMVVFMAEGEDVRHLRAAAVTVGH